jgi:hypothetical protein
VQQESIDSVPFLWFLQILYYTKVQYNEVVLLLETCSTAHFTDALLLTVVCHQLSKGRENNGSHLNTYCTCRYSVLDSLPIPILF